MNDPNVVPAGETQLTIRAELFGSDCCIGFGLTARGAAPVLALCRKLVEAGHDPALALEAYRGETLCLRIRSIGEAACLTVEDSRHGTPRFRHRHGSRAGVAEGYGRASPIAPIGPGGLRTAQSRQEPGARLNPHHRHQRRDGFHQQI